MFAPDVLSTALAVRGGTCARALERVVDRDMALVLTPALLRVTLGRLVRLFGYEREAVCRAGVLLRDLCDWHDAVAESGLARGSDVARHLGEATLCRPGSTLVRGDGHAVLRPPPAPRRRGARGDRWWFLGLRGVDVRDFVGQRPIRPLAADEPAPRDRPR